MTKSHTCNRLTSVMYRHVTKVAGFTVTDIPVKLQACSRCGDVSIPSLELESFERRAARIILSEAKAVNGEVLRFARKALGLRQHELGAILRRTTTQISRDEKRRELPMLLRLAVCELLSRTARRESLTLVGSSTGNHFEMTLS